jgi:hypothetical protein|tara:strand:- start:3144 stop:3446 length:303 start_codon:yes stop_codon:yes gene_type:complete
MGKTPQKFKDAVKLIVLCQSVLEQMDTVKGTDLYRHKIKNQINSLEKTMENMIFKPLLMLDHVDEDLFTRIQLNVDMVMDMDVDELSQMRISLDELRETE